MIIYMYIHTYIYANIDIHTYTHTNYTCRSVQGDMQAMNLPIIHLSLAIHRILTSNSKG